MSRPRENFKQWTLQEKAALCSGQDFWHLKPQPHLGVPPLLVTDGPHGVRKQRDASSEVNFHSVAATCFPTASAMACSWNRDLLHRVGRALAEECLQEGVSVLLGPGANIKRSPLCGRNFEYFSEDPLLSGELAAAWINGLQSQGVGASLKHYAVNNQEHYRATIDVRVDSRTLRELYLAGFELAIRQAQPWTVMCAYNRVNGVYCSEHEWLLTRILRDEWGFEGVVVTDWGACNDRVAGLRAGQDLEMPGSGGLNDRRIVAAVRAGDLEEQILDLAAGRLVRLLERGKQALRPSYRYDAEQHHALARRTAAESAVLLQNRNGVLPVESGRRLAVLGRLAQQPRYQGAGSSQITPWRLDTFWEALQSHSGEYGYAAGYPDDPEAVEQGLVEEACALAARMDVAIILVGLPATWESEALDREHMALPASHNELVRRVAAVQPNTIVVLCCGAPVELPWADEVAAIVAAYLGGQAGGSALADLLLGRVNFSGKLAETWPALLEDTPCHAHFPGGPDRVEYREALYVGYRYYDALRAEVARRKVRFPFGHGLSYTHFEYGAVELSSRQLMEGESLQVTIEVTNRGDLTGAEVVQLYVRDRAAPVFRPRKELKGFEKLSLAPGQRGTVRFVLDRRAFAFFHPPAERWLVAPGQFDLLIGASSMDIRACETVWVESSDPMPEDDQAASQYRTPPEESTGFDAAAFQTLFHSAMLSPLPAEAGYHLNSTLGELRQTVIGNYLYQAVLRASLGAAAGEEHAAVNRMMMRRMVENMPLRQAVLFSRGRLNYRMAMLLLALMNRRFGRALAYCFPWVTPW